MSTATETALPEIPDKRYFAIGEASDLCGVKTHVLRYWEQEFPQLSPSKRRGNRRYYRVADIQVARTIRGLLYDQGFTIAGARARMADDAAAVSPYVDELRTIRRALENIRQRLDD